MINHDDISALIREAAELHIRPRFKALKDADIREKSNPNDLVTQADLDAEEFLTARLPDLLQGSLVLGEEGEAAGAVTEKILDQDDAPVWVIDPVDGTYNFVHGRDEFGVIVALVDKGETVAGWIYDVPGDRMAVAEKGQGAVIESQTMVVTHVGPIEEMVGRLGSKFFAEQHREHLKEARKKVAKCFSAGCAAHEYLSLANGQSQFSIYRRTKTWDHLAGVLMTQEAGGYAARYDGTAYGPRNRDGGLLISTNPESWRKVHDVFLKPLGI